MRPLLCSDAPLAPAPPGFAAILRLSDARGMMQHSRLSVPDPAHGYCVDDNARALILMHCRADLPADVRERWTSVFRRFVADAWNPPAGRFRNFMAADGAWLEDAGSDDSNGRALWSLGVAGALALFDEAAPRLPGLRSPRALAFCALGGAAVLQANPGHEPARAPIEAAGVTLARLAVRYARPGWNWFEPVLAYDNARISEALLRGGAALGREDWMALGLETLAWLWERQQAPEGHFRAVGCQSFGRPYAEPLPYDQQPLEAQGMIEAADAAFAVSGDPVWIERAGRAFAWFLGANDCGVPLADWKSGECYDGLTPTGPNLNQGAESVLAFQLGAMAMGRLREKAAAR